MSFNAISDAGVSNIAGQAQTALTGQAQTVQSTEAVKPAGNSSTRDSVEISEQGKKLAATQKQEAEKTAGNNTIASMTFKSGRTATIEKVMLTAPIQMLRISQVRLRMNTVPPRDKNSVFGLMSLTQTVRQKKHLFCVKTQS